VPELNPRTISVSGTGRVTVEPDLADLRLGVSVTTKTVEEARASNATSMNRVLETLAALGIAKRDIQTSNLSLSPVYDYSTDANPPRLTGYSLTNTVAITIRDLANVGKAIDRALEAGATSFDSISFRLEDPSAAEQEARAAAVVDARAKAETLAAAAGASLGEIAAISEAGVAAPFPVFRREMAMMAARDAATPIEAGTNEVAISVLVTYLIG
jgi:uncharacterized protein YggE